jgi:hypothetical protein
VYGNQTSNDYICNVKIKRRENNLYLENQFQFSVAIYVFVLVQTRKSVNFVATRIFFSEYMCLQVLQLKLRYSYENLFLAVEMYISG